MPLAWQARMFSAVAPRASREPARKTGEPARKSGGHLICTYRTKNRISTSLKKILSYSPVAVSNRTRPPCLDSAYTIFGL